MSWKTSSLTGVLLFCCAGGAFAQQSTGEDSGLGTDPCLTDVICRARFNRGRKLSKEDKFDEALASYEAAYQLKPVPWLLINIGRTLHKLGRPGEAVEHYQRYLSAEPAGPQERRQRAEQFLREAQDEAALLRARKPVVVAPPLILPTEVPTEEPAPAPLFLPPPEPPPAVVTVAKPPSVDKHRSVPGSGWLWGSLAAGGALLLSSAGTGGAALAAAQSGKGAVYVGDPSAEALDAQARARTLGIATDVLLGVGAATVGVATVTYLVKRARTRRSEAVRAFLPGGTMLSGGALLGLSGVY